MKSLNILFHNSHLDIVANMQIHYISSDFQKRDERTRSNRRQKWERNASIFIYKSQRDFYAACK